MTAEQAAALRFGFRAPRPGEDPQRYRRDLIAHVHRCDYAAAHELRIGKPQAEWNGADVEGFAQVMLSRRKMPSEDFPPGSVRVFDGAKAGPYPVSDDFVKQYAGAALDALADARAALPHADLPIVANALLTDGSILSAIVEDPGDRVALLKHWARTESLFGFWIVFDAWMHLIEGEGATAKASKRDALLVHAGTRSFRLIRRRTYAVVDGRVIFDDPPPPDLDPRDPTLGHAEDPYAGIFVSVPVSKGRPS